MREENYTSLELSKKLQKNGFELETTYLIDTNEWMVFQNWRNWFRDWYRENDDLDCMWCWELIHAYDILNDLCVRYAIKLFWFNDWHDTADRVFQLMMLWRKQEAEIYIWEHCLFNPKNKPWKT